jgi:parvulin-like peptidyl-prolyl isomerase
MKYNLSVFLALILILITNCNADMQTKVAKYDNGFVTYGEVQESYRALTDDERAKFTNTNEYFKFVRQIALEKIIVDKAVNEGLADTKDFVSKIEDIKKKTVYNLLKKNKVLDKINISEADYARYKKKYDLYQIVKRSDTLDNAKIDQSKTLLANLSKQIKDLDSFKENAVKYSDDVTAKEGGFVGKIRPGIMDDQIDKVMESLGTGKVSKVIETNSTLHIIFVNSIENTSFDELLKDKDLYNAIYKEKENKLENEWYENILADFSLNIDKKEMNGKTADETVVVRYKDKTITRKEILLTVEKLRQNNTFPEPTEDELFNLVRNMGLNLILEDKMNDKEMTGSKEFKDRIEAEKKFLLVNDYIKKHAEAAPITDEDIKKFYDENINTLFSFKQDNGKLFVQNLSEVREFISQKLETKYIQDARYNLYRKLVDETHFKVDDKSLELLIKELKK